MRNKLKRMDGERVRFRAVFVRFGEVAEYGGRVKETLLLHNVVDICTGGHVTDHLWFKVGKRWDQVSLHPGDVVEFDARVKSYKKGYRGWRDIEAPLPSTDYKLSWPTKIKVMRRESDDEDRSGVVGTTLYYGASSEE